MKKERKAPRVRLNHGVYSRTPTVDRVAKRIRLSKDKDESLLLYETKECEAVDP